MYRHHAQLPPQQVSSSAQTPSSRHHWDTYEISGIGSMRQPLEQCTTNATENTALIAVPKYHFTPRHVLLIMQHYNTTLIRHSNITILQ